MKIAMIGQKGIPSRAGGIEIHVEEIGKRLVQYGCEVEVYCRKGYCNIEEENFLGIKIKHAPFIHTKHLDAITHTFFSTMKALFSRVDIFHYHALGPSTLALIPRLFGKKVVCTVHGLDWQRGKWGGAATSFLKFGEYASAKFPHATINVSSNLVKYYKEKYNISTTYIPNGIERQVIIEPNIILKKYSLRKDDYILFLARLVPEKGAHYLIEAYKSLNTNKKLVVAGGTSHSDKYVKELYDLAEDNNNIIFTGFVKGKELAELYSNAYVYVLPSDIEGLPISLLEAMSYGNCCLVSDIPENTSVIESFGYSFIRGDVNDLSNVLSKLIEKKEDVERIKSNVQEYVLLNYSWEEIANSTLNFYKEIIKKS